MANRHVKVINGRKYYYESIRVGKKVTSKYLGPVERIRKKKMSTMEEQPQSIEMPAQPVQQPAEEADDSQAEDNYIG